MAPTPTPVPTDPAFDSRPASGPISLSGAACQGITISNKTFANLGAGVIAINLSGCNGVTITDVDFDHVAEGVFAYQSQNITVTRTRYREIIGPSTRDGGHHGNLVQFDTVTGFTVTYNKGVGGDTEDIVSLYKSNTGRVGYNQFQGTDWVSGSGTGIIVGDGGGGSGVEVDHNILDEPGQVGIQLVNGNPNVHDNIVYAEPRLGQMNPNVGMSTYGGTVSGAQVNTNRVYWRHLSGSGCPGTDTVCTSGTVTENPYWWGAGTPSTSGDNWHDTTLTAAALAVDLSTLAIPVIP